jgi:hypothetical protein
MASTPAFANTPRIGTGLVATANTNFDGTGTLVDVLTGVSAGTRVDRLVVQANGDPADCIVCVFYYDGTSNWLFDQFDIGNPAAASTTVAAYREERVYTDFVLPTSTSKVRASITVAPTAGSVYVFALGADLT